MATTLNLLGQLSKRCRLLGCRWRVTRTLSSGSSNDEDVHASVSDSISRQILQAGFNYLKEGDIDSLRENAKNRAASVDFDNLVHTIVKLIKLV